MKRIILMLICGYTVASSSLRQEEPPLEEVLGEKIDAEESSNVIDADLLKGTIFIPTEHVNGFEEAMTPRIEELVLDEGEEFYLQNEEMHRDLGAKHKVRWCRVCTGVGTPYTGDGGCYYRHNFRGSDAYHDHRAMKGTDETDETTNAKVSENGDVDVPSNEHESRNLKKRGGSYDKLRGSYDISDSYDGSFGTDSYDASYDSDSYDSDSYDSSSDSYTSHSRRHKRGRGPKWHCYDAWKYGTYVG